MGRRLGHATRRSVRRRVASQEAVPDWKKAGYENESQYSQHLKEQAARKDPLANSVNRGQQITEPVGESTVGLENVGTDFSAQLVNKNEKDDLKKMLKK